MGLITHHPCTELHLLTKVQRWHSVVSEQRHGEKWRYQSPNQSANYLISYAKKLGLHSGTAKHGLLPSVTTENVSPLLKCCHGP